MKNSTLKPPALRRENKNRAAGQANIRWETLERLRIAAPQLGLSQMDIASDRIDDFLRAEESAGNVRFPVGNSFLSTKK